MKIDCAIAGDLLPLYVDNVCSAESRKAVQEHLEVCEKCRMLARRLGDGQGSQTLQLDMEQVLQHRNSAVRRKSFVAGSIIAGIFAIPVLVCLIVNLCVGAALDWFFIVLVSLMLASSLLVVPLMVPKYKFLFTFGSSLFSLVLLLLVCALYSGGRWFFVAVLSVLFGVGLTVFPFVLQAEPIKTLFGRYKTLTYFALNTLLYGGMMTAIGAYAPQPDFWPVTLAVSLPIGAYLWLMMADLHYLPLGKWFRAAGASLLSGMFLFSANWQVGKLMGAAVSMPQLRPGDSINSFNNHILWLLLLIGIVCCVVFTAIGLCRKERKK